MSDPSRKDPSDDSAAGNGEVDLQQQVRDYSRAARRYMWASLNRESFFSALKTLAWLIPSTFFIWIYAERQQTVTTPAPGVPIPIQIRIDDPKKVVWPKIQGPVFIAQLNGPNGQVDAIQAEISRRGGENPIVLKVDSNTTAGAHSESAVRLLGQSELFNRYAGVTPINCKPENLEIVVDEYEDRQIEVQASPDTKNLAEAPVFTPSTITVRAPHTAFPSDGTPVIAYADLNSTNLLNSPGSQTANNVKITVPQVKPASPEFVKYSAMSVKAVFEVRQLDATLTLSSVGVSISDGQSIQKDAYVECQPVVNNVTLKGPPEKIEMLRTGSAVVKAVLEVDRKDTDGATRTGNLRYMFSDGMEGVVVTSGPQTIEYRMVKRPTE